ncbi:MAG: 2-dehydropantoate 2-reductase [Gammaproteobacteria bacterium]|nr:2-dehydropantoate 2-reductase [Gammaproteobacteria bacterium]
MRIAVFGTGGIGGYIGGRLVAGEDVVFVARGKTLEALRTGGLRVDSIAGDFTVPRVQAVEGTEHAGTFDVVLLCVKAWQVADAARALSPMLGAASCVLPLQNGVEAPAILAAELTREKVLGGLCSLMAYVIAPGHVRHAGGEPFVKFGELGNHRSERVVRIHRAFERAHGLAVEIAPDIDAAMWEKFLFIAAWGGVGSVARAPVGIIRTQPGTRKMLQQAMMEIVNVAKARGVDVPPDAPATALDLMGGMPDDATASMQRDIMAGMPSELEAQTGAMVRLGREAGVETPINALIYASLLPRELHARRQLHW